VFNAIFSNILAISWRPVLVREEALNKRLNKYADNIELITKMQAGFRKYFYIAFTYFYLLIFW
jgi:hypothetical protein